MKFGWDPAKSEATYKERGFNFAYASRIFATDWIESEDARVD
jgi:uncharacterized DUF497 family protein